jgi:hypothetical protein
MGYLGNQITTVFPTSISVDSATINGNTNINGDTAKLTLTDTSSHSANTGPEVSFFSKDSGGTSREVAKIVGESHSGSNEGNLAFQTRNGGTLETKWKVFKNGNMLPSNSAYGIYLGTSSVADSNLLDHYEEGTWTPTLVSTSGATRSVDSQVSRYTRIGRICYVSCQIGTIGALSGSNTGTLKVDGLPFNYNGSVSKSITADIRFQHVDLPSGIIHPTLLQNSSGTTNEFFFSNVFDNAGAGELGISSFGTSSDITFSLVYEVA